jgi:hypothetical protein
MFFKKKKTILAIELGKLLTSFIQLNTNKGIERIVTEKTKNISQEDLRLEYFIFSVFIADYVVTVKIKDIEIKNLVLDSFYLNIKNHFDDESFKLMNLKLDAYAKIIRENKDWSIIVQNLGFAFSRKILDEVDLILSLRIGEEFVQLSKVVDELIQESKLIT